jgi:predicted amidohydrolase YtcJ
MDGEESADRVGPIAVVNARIWTGDARRRWADALLTDGDRIAVMGSSAEVMKRVGAGTTVIDAEGRLLVPRGDALTHSSAVPPREAWERGRLARGGAADFTMVDRDITRISAVDIAGARVVITVVGGRLVYQAAEP